LLPKSQTSAWPHGGMVAQRHPSNAVQRHHGIPVNHGDQRRNYSGDDAADIHPIMVTCGGTSAALMQRIFTQSW